MYLKVTNSIETHHGLQYHDGLNIDPVPFVKEGSCCAGGIYFTTPEYICYFIGMGIYIREVTIPEDAEMVQDPNGDKWRASKVILGPRKDLREVNTWKWLVGNTNANAHEALRWAAYNRYIEVLKYLVENGAEICGAVADDALKFVSGSGCLELVKYLVEKGANIHALDDVALRSAAYYGHLDVVKYLIDNGANLQAERNYIIKHTSACGYLELVKYLTESGADIHAENDYALRYAFMNGHLEVVKYLVENGADINSCNNDYILKYTSARGHMEVIKYLEDITNGK